MNHTRYNHMTDAEFLRVALDAQDPLTATVVQTELLNRFEKLLEVADGNLQFKERLADTGTYVDTDDEVTQLVEFLHVANEHHCTDVSVLREKLERADKFYDIAQEVGDTLKKLADLAATIA